MSLWPAEVTQNKVNNDFSFQKRQPTDDSISALLFHLICYLHKHYFHLLWHMLAWWGGQFLGAQRPSQTWSQKYPERRGKNTVFKSMYFWVLHRSFLPVKKKVREKIVPNRTWHIAFCHREAAYTKRWELELFDFQENNISPYIFKTTLSVTGLENSNIWQFWQLAVWKHGDLKTTWFLSLWHYVFLKCACSYKFKSIGVKPKLHSCLAC